MKTRHKIRDLLQKIAPSVASQFLAWRSQRLIMRIERQSGVVEASKNFISQNGAEVLDGPFKGMRYPKSTIQKRNLIPKLIGSYEDELHEWISILSTNNYREIINVGSADGYYSVGFAMLFPQASITSFDTDPWARSATRELAKTNGTENTLVRSMCNTSWLRENLKSDTLIIVDCEGYEETLLDPAIVEGLFSADIIVELHDHAAQNIEETLRKRFMRSHIIQSVAWRKKKGEEYPRLKKMPSDLADKAVSEGRGAPQSWLLMTTRDKS